MGTEQTWWERTKPYIWGAVGGAIATVIVGFAWGGWVTGGSAEKAANDRAEVAMKAVATNILPALCAGKAKSDPDAAKLTEVAALTSPSQQTSKILETQWVTFEDLTLSSVNKRALADACQKLLFPPTEAAKTTG